MEDIELFNKRHDQFLINNVKSLYKYILVDGATIKSVERIEKNIYRVTLFFNANDLIHIFSVYLAPIGNKYDILQLTPDVWS
ncbi:hypothetical protein LCGC14_2357010 [marine sediment metagenome]|uniref:Uncharacterized protein n=1 Tax=marine sediment metagenome TaxID=412755 RepID=A0A0F9F2M9_9ZZZZ